MHSKCEVHEAAHVRVLKELGKQELSEERSLQETVEDRGAPALIAFDIWCVFMCVCVCVCVCLSKQISSFKGVTKTSMFRPGLTFHNTLSVISVG